MRSLFRRLEPTLGLPRNRPEAGYLEQPDARRWLSLEAAALRRALTSQGPAFQEALEDAIVFRVWRRARFKPDSNAERILELNEGLGEFTARMLVTPKRPELTRQALELLDRVSARGFARAFGLAYGLLMEGRKKSRWRGLIDGEVDLGLVFAKSGTWPRARLRGRSRTAGPALPIAYGSRALKFSISMFVAFNNSTAMPVVYQMKLPLKRLLSDVIEACTPVAKPVM